MISDWLSFKRCDSPNRLHVNKKYGIGDKVPVKGNKCSLNFKADYCLYILSIIASVDLLREHLRINYFKTITTFISERK